jgi:hypothetical protein
LETPSVEGGPRRDDEEMKLLLPVGIRGLTDRAHAKSAAVVELEMAPRGPRQEAVGLLAPAKLAVQEEARHSYSIDLALAFTRGR